MQYLFKIKKSSQKIYTNYQYNMSEKCLCGKAGIDIEEAFD